MGSITNNNYMSHTSSPKEGSSSGSAEYIKLVEKLIDSDEDEKKQINQLQAMFPILKKINAFMSNQKKLSIFMKDIHFRHRLVVKLKDCEKEPTLKVRVTTVRGADTNEQLDSTDIHAAFQRFGAIQQLYIQKGTAYISFSNIVSAYLAIQSLNSLQIQDGLKICTQWCTLDELQVLEALRQYSKKTKIMKTHEEDDKTVGKYEIYLESSHEFNIAQRIIGPSGAYLKKILAQVAQKSKTTVESVAKIRLRGRGSGYKEQPFNRESDQVLSLYVSSKDIHVFRIISFQIEKLLTKISQDYKFSVQKKLKKICEGTAYRKFESKERNVFELVKQINLHELQSMLDEGAPISEAQILKSIQVRNIARKKGNFKQADAVRERLKKKGICLVDTGQNMTSWSFFGK